MQNMKNKKSFYNNLTLITNRAYVRSHECKSQCADAKVFINKISDLSVTQTTTYNRFEINKMLSYFINVKNIGPSNSSGVFLYVVPAPSVIFKDIVLSQGYFLLKKECIICHLGNINTADKVKITLKVTTKEKYSLINSVFVIGNEFDPNKENNADFLESSFRSNPSCDIYKLVVIIILLYILYKVHSRRDK